MARCLRVGGGSRFRVEIKELQVPRSGNQGRDIYLAIAAMSGQFEAWIREVAPWADLVILEAPPLSVSVDGALLACASDGLMIVAERDVTGRAVLATAAERARVTGCRTLGIVMTGNPEPLPGWMQKIMTVAGHTPPPRTEGS